jgi:hypothetical protein
MPTPKLLLPAAVIGLLLVWSGPVDAVSITFLEPPFHPDQATLTSALPGVLDGSGTSLANAMLDAGSGLTVSTPETGRRENVLSLVLPLLDNWPLDQDPTVGAALGPDAVQPVPEPSTLLLFGSIMAGLGMWARRRRKRD